MRSVRAATREFIRGEEGISVVEYALTLLLIAVATVAGIATLGAQLSRLFDAASTSI